MRLAMLAMAGCTVEDADWDGFAADEDCDDADPFVYPGAPELPADGIDADCDGADPPDAVIGDWTLTSLDADYAGVALFIRGTAEGEMAVAEDLTAVFDVSAQLDFYGGFPLTFAMSGDVSRTPGPSEYGLYAEAEVYGESVHVDWDCEIAVDGAAMTCGGELKAFDSGWASIATFERR